MRWTLHFSLPISSLYLHVCRRLFIPRTDSAFQRPTGFALRPLGITFVFQETSPTHGYCLRRFVGFVAMCVRSKARFNSHLHPRVYKLILQKMVPLRCINGQLETNVISIRIDCNQLLSERHSGKRHHSAQDLYSKETRLHRLLGANIRAKQLRRERR